jgi:hypothetical protein
MILCISLFILTKSENLVSSEYRKKKIAGEIDIVINEPYCSLCLIQLNEVFESKDFQDVSIRIVRCSSRSTYSSFDEIQIREYLSNVKIKQFKFEECHGNVGSPFLRVMNNNEWIVISHKDLFESFNRKRIQKTIIRLLE